ncbi:MAG: hypothetical protein V4629_12020, partial [Pseudomonadota bacterium]
MNQDLKRIQWIESIRPYITHTQYMFLHSRIFENSSLQQFAEQHNCSEENARQIMRRLHSTLEQLNTI